jgi:hypothetical protein
MAPNVSQSFADHQAQELTLISRKPFRTTSQVKVEIQSQNLRVARECGLDSQ